ncbi:MAG: EIIABC-Fru [Candidatus Hydrogenedentota bacterium]|jgi:mannitol/fructose-specific phosphotransferase system IIA component (Ntr-type)
MLLHELLRPELIKVPLEAEKKSEAISELVDVLVQYHELPLSQRHAVVEEFAANEWAVGSGLERGIALPHIHTDRVEDVVCALGISSRGVNFSNLDDKPSTVVLLTLSPKKGLSQDLESLAGIARLIESRTLVGRLSQAKSGQEAFDILKAESA